MTSEAPKVRTIVLRVVALALLLLLVLAGVLTLRTLNRLPNAVIYFVRAEPTMFTLVQASRSVTGDTTEARLREAISAMIAGPNASEAAQGLTSSFDPGTRVLSVTVQGARATINLSSELTQGGGTALMTGRLNQLLYTATQPSSIHEVVVLVDGQPLQTLGGEGLIVPSPWRRPESDALPRW
jgi:spore germination protein GerM